ncbi:MAG: anthranilate synthase component I [Phycisphaerae bacterium]
MRQDSREFAVPSFDDFKKYAAPGAIVPVYVPIAGDYLTPVSAYQRLRGASAYSFLLESVVGGERVARYSFLGMGPAVVFEARGQQVTVSERSDDSKIRASVLQAVDPLAELEKRLGRAKAVRLPGLPAFTGGAVGYAGYDTVRYLEPEKLANPPEDTRHLPDIMFGIYDDLIIFDHAKKIILVVANVHVDDSDTENLYRRAVARIARMIQTLNKPARMHLDMLQLNADVTPTYTSNFSRADFEKAVAAAKEYIKAGDIFQVVLSQCLNMRTQADPFDIYRALRVINPSPFMFYLNSPACMLVGSSPEIMCRVEDGVITNRPLAGTRPRGKTPEQDAALEAELLADPKERAEHVMLVDLGRNDVGRVSVPGSVKISDAMTVERYSHVMHITTNVTGKLADGKTCFDALRNTLPVGTVSGAPKIRAMQIIDELEPTRRGPYAGAVGYIDYAKNMDTCIALRTMVIMPVVDDASSHHVYVQAGAGLVADSVPTSEYQESLNKAAALLKAVAMAEAGLS